MSNVDDRLNTYTKRLTNLETESRAIADAKRDLATEMKSAKLTKEEIAAVKLAVRRNFESAEKKEFRETVESLAEALGGYADTPLGAAAVERFAAE